MILRLTRSQVGALKECIDFLTNGYFIRVSLVSQKEWIIYLNHRRNSRKLAMFVKRDVYTVGEVGKLPEVRRFDKQLSLMSFDVDSDICELLGDSWESLRRQLVFASDLGYINAERN